MKSDEIRMIVKEAVHETLSGLGLNIGSPQEMQADFVYIRRMRKGSEFMSRRIKASVITVAIPTFLYLLWDTIRNAVGQ